MFGRCATSAMLSALCASLLCTREMRYENQAVLMHQPAQLPSPMMRHSPPSPRLDTCEELAVVEKCCGFFAEVEAQSMGVCEDIR